MITVRDLLRTKGSDVWSVSPRTTTLDALQLMAAKSVGALMVLEEGALVGIISERDFAYHVAGASSCKLDIPVEEYMTKEVFVIGPEQTIQDCMQLMTHRHIRHLPVIDQGQLIGLISIGDVVKQIISNQEITIHQLEDYITGRGYGQ